MNAKSLKQNFVLVITVLVTVLAAAWLLWLGHKASARGREIESELQTQTEQLTRLLQSRPSPTADNIKVLSQDREQLGHLYPSIVQAVSRSTVQTPQLRRPVEFQELLARKIKRLRQSAAEVGVEVPDGFAFGFGRYATALPCQGATAEDCSRILAQLATQLIVVERLCEMLLTSKIERIEHIRRQEIESGSSDDAIGVALSTDAKAVYKALPFELHFQCNTERLRSFLNSVSQSDWFFVIRTLRAEAEASGAGGAMPDRLAVTMRVDLLEFPAAPTGQGK